MLLLKAVMNETDKKHPDYALCQQAAEKMEQVLFCFCFVFACFVDCNTPGWHDGERAAARVRGGGAAAGAAARAVGTDRRPENTPPRRQQKVSTLLFSPTLFAFTVFLQTKDLSKDLRTLCCGKEKRERASMCCLRICSFFWNRSNLPD
jgi:hypothetical protein